MDIGAAAAIKRFVGNVTSRKIAALLGTIILAFVCMFFIFNDENWRLVAFGALVVILALGFPAYREPLPKDATDFWYYSLACLGVVLFFLNNDAARTRAETQVQWLSAETIADSERSALADFNEEFKRIEDIASGRMSCSRN